MPVAHPRPTVVIVGGGFGGLYAARALRSAPVQVILIDRSNHHLFQPLLYQVATATLPPTDIGAPIRWLLRKQRNATVLMGEVARADIQRREVHVSFDGEQTAIGYDYLILAAGSRHAYFGHPEWEADAPGLKTLEDAFEIRRRFLLAFEEAEWSEDRTERLRHQTFVIVGGGPTGVELAGIVPEIARRTLRRDFRRLNPAETRVILIEGGPRLLPTFSPETSARVLRDLTELGVEVRLQTMVTSVDRCGVNIGAEYVPAGNVFWAAGNHASSLGASTGAPTDAQGRVLVNRDLSLPGASNVFVAGDLAYLEQDGKPVPGVAPAAMQQGRAAARNIVRLVRGEGTREFRYVNKGNLATIGRERAVAEFPFLRAAGRPAWWFWLFLHILYLAGFRNRLSVLLSWAYAYYSYERGARLITSGD